MTVALRSTFVALILIATLRGELAWTVVINVSSLWTQAKYPVL